jgi:hypothetical protein
LKSDPPIADGRLQQLRAEAVREVRDRVPAVAAILADIGLPGDVQPLAAGTFHVVHRVDTADGRALAFRSSLPGLFAQDRGLLLDDRVRTWLEGAEAATCVPRTLHVGFRSQGAPFDFAISAFADGVTLRDLGDAVLDEEPGYLFGMGQALRRVHQVEGSGAGLVDCDTAAGAAPAGVHAAWRDYVTVRLPDHVGACARIGHVSTAQADAILRTFADMQPALAGRPVRLLHGDLGTHNVCVDPSTRAITALLDWEDALVGDPLYDVAMVSSFQPERRMGAFLAGYGLDPTIEEQRLISLYFLRIALFKAVHRFRFAVVDRPDRAPSHLRIHRALDELRRLA